MAFKDREFLTGREVDILLIRAASFLVATINQVEVFGRDGIVAV